MPRQDAAAGEGCVQVGAVGGAQRGQQSRSGEIGDTVSGVGSMNAASTISQPPCSCSWLAVSTSACREWRAAVGLFGLHGST